ncbi:MAG: DUF3524 domain-containing protein [Deltaproteobacteria bacterium]|nr:DUF3524 domain-containing protein [Deltaproteobacteria bacterium]MBW2069794.1 DUF3524 domain-containing protein [Deltaproteobacteria bacterium]
MKFLFLEPFYGGSHRDFADGLLSHSSHHLQLLTLPARFWKWRMRGAALHFARKVDNPAAYAGLLLTDLMSLADLRAIWGDACPKALVYFHENQLSYPLPPGERLDYQFGFTNITTALAAQRILFNSQSHMEAFFELLSHFIKMMPEYRTPWVVTEIRSKAALLYPGCRYPAGPPDLQPWDYSRPPLIIWNHRWEFDKDPQMFFCTLSALQDSGIEFRLALLGENFQTVPREFLEAREKFDGRIVQYGYVSSKSEYINWLKKGTVVVSTALQENFGISVVEAIRYGCYPVLPNRLSYPELIPRRFHRQCLYSSEQDLLNLLAAVLQQPTSFEQARKSLASHMERFSWQSMIEHYDAELEKLAAA